MRNYCTLFNINYGNRGKILIDSLTAHSTDFTLYILALDEKTVAELSAADNPRIRVIPLENLENYFPVLNKLKGERSRTEYFWTLSPFILSYCLEQFQLPACTYLDADLAFYEDPERIFSEAEKHGYSAIITEHDYTPKYDQTITSGKYCVQFMTFKNNDEGRKILYWWKDRCTEWCFARNEDGKFGDQKYLDDWTTRFTGVYVPEPIGLGAALWNIQKYDILTEGNSIFLRDKITKRTAPLVFFHFHGITQYRNGIFRIVNYEIDTETWNLLQHYLNSLVRYTSPEVEKLLETCAYPVKVTFYAKFKRHIRTILHELKAICLERTEFDTTCVKVNVGDRENQSRNRNDL